VRDWIAAREPGSTHQGFPVVGANDELLGVVTRRDLLDLDLPIDSRVRDLVRGPAIVTYEDVSARQAADTMVRHNVGRLPVVSREDPRRVVGIITRSDLLEAHERRLAAASRAHRHLELPIRAWITRSPVR
jgi:CBS domain-containing protein